MDGQCQNDEIREFGNDLATTFNSCSNIMNPINGGKKKKKILKFKNDYNKVKLQDRNKPAIRDF